MDNTVDSGKSIQPSEPLKTAYNILGNPQSDVTKINHTLENILEKVGNVEDCFWISHAWAESLINGRTIPKINFPFLSIEIKNDPVWKKDRPDYKGTHVSHGAEAYLVTQLTKGVNGDLLPRDYHHLISVKGLDQLRRHLEQFNNGQLAMILADYEEKKEGHAFLAAKINGNVVVIDNSMEPGPWLKSMQDLGKDYSEMKQFYVYDYAEPIYNLQLQTPSNTS